MKLIINKLKKSFKDKVVFNEASITIPSGIYIVTGSSGSGKTTFAKILCKLEASDGGNIEPSAANTAYMFQEPRLFPWLTVLENICSVTNCDKKRALELLFELDLKDDINKHPYELSVGMQRRVALARTLSVDNAKIYIFDEPLAGLDVDRQKAASRLIRDNVPHDSVTLIISHEINELMNIADGIISVENGKIEWTNKNII